MNRKKKTLNPQKTTAAQVMIFVEMYRLFFSHKLAHTKINIT